MKNREPLTQARIRALVDYDPETGKFTRKCASGTAKVGDEAGWIEPTGYRKISLDGHKYYAHRCVFLYMDGSWPNDTVDHVNGERSDNRRCNLRDAGQSINGQNRKRARRDNKCGLLGAHYHAGAGKYAAEIGYGHGQRRYLGLFATKEEAHEAYMRAKRELHAGFAP